ncbi:MAG: pentapeptide repeat-containing protein, partial [Hyphomonadaceae bacterium]
MNATPLVLNMGSLEQSIMMVDKQIAASDETWLDHHRWLETKGEEGKAATFAGVDLTGMVIPSGTSLKNAKFFDCDLTDADFSGARDLLVAQLAGSTLTRTKLPEECNPEAESAALSEMVKSAGKYYLALLGGSSYVLLTLATTTDATLLQGASSLNLPVFGTPVSVATFYTCAPIALTIAHLYFQFEMLAIWRAIGSLPAHLRDGRSLMEHLHSWMPLSFAEGQVKRLTQDEDLLNALKRNAVTFLLWFYTPLTIAATIVRYLPCRNMEVLHTQLTTLSLILAMSALLYSSAKQHLSLHLKRTHVRFTSLALFALILFGASFGLKSLSYHILKQYIT